MHQFPQFLGSDIKFLYSCFKEILLSFSLLFLDNTLSQCFFLGFLLDFQSFLENEVLSLHTLEYAFKIVRLLIRILQDTQYRLV